MHACRRERRQLNRIFPMRNPALIMRYMRNSRKIPSSRSTKNPCKVSIAIPKQAMDSTLERKKALKETLTPATVMPAENARSRPIPMRGG